MILCVSREDVDGWVLRLAYDRGLRGCTFATHDELRTPGYDAAWTAGATEAAKRDYTAQVTASRA